MHEKGEMCRCRATTFTIYLGEEGSDDAASEVQEGYPVVEGINPEMQDGYTDQMPSNDSPADEAQAS
jgi:hypothetical protein